MGNGTAGMSMKIAAVLFLCVIAAAAVWGSLPPAAKSVNGPADEFSAERAAETVRVIAQSPRLVGNPAFEAAKTTLIGQLNELGLETETQETVLEGVKVENILAKLEGTSGQEAILLTTHLDSVETTPGAMDDASGVAEVLETVRAIREGSRLKNTIMVLISGPEEICCYGAKAFATQHAWAKDVRLVINTDAGGVSGPSILAASGPQEGWVIRELAGCLPRPIASSAIEVFGSPATDYADELRNDGYMGLDFNLSWQKRIHTPLDDAAHINLNSIQHQGEHMLAAARHFGNLSLDIPKEPLPIYFDVLGTTVIHYPTTWAMPIFMILALATGGMVILGVRSKKLSLRGTAYGAGIFLASIISVPLLLGVVQVVIIQPLLASTPGLGAELIGDSVLSNSIRWGGLLLALVSSLSWPIFIQKKKKLEWESITTGYFLFLFAAAGITSAALPATSYLLAWPSLFGVTAMASGFLPRNRKLEQVYILGATAAGAAAILLFLPVVLMATFAIDIRMIYLGPASTAGMMGFLVGATAMILKR
jgi:hypothetical protein